MLFECPCPSFGLCVSTIFGDIGGVLVVGTLCAIATAMAGFEPFVVESVAAVTVAVRSSSRVPLFRLFADCGVAGRPVVASCGVSERPPLAGGTSELLLVLRVSTLMSRDRSDGGSLCEGEGLASCESGPSPTMEVIREGAEVDCARFSFSFLL